MSRDPSAHKSSFTYRIEEDALGKRSISDEFYFGIQTVRAIENFSVSNKTISDLPEFVESIIHIKQAAALANLSISALSAKKAEAIVAAGNYALSNIDRSHFPVDVFHGGGGTSANMNVNEVLANRANEDMTGRKGYSEVHPNSDVNMGQSTNDVIPSAMKIAAYRLLSRLEITVSSLVDSLRQKEAEFDNVIKVARTCLQDALPVTLGHEFSGYRQSFVRALDELRRWKTACLNIPLGATAVGTGYGSLPGYRDAIYPHLRQMSGVAVGADENFFDALQNADHWLGISAALRTTALALSKMCADLRLLSSGPRAGLSEISLPAVQPGSSIMPGKTNPVLPEMGMQIYFRVLGNDATVARGAEGELDLNVWEMVMFLSLNESILLLDNGIPLIASRCIDGITANREICRAKADSSLALSTAIASVFDYPAAVRVAQFAAANDLTIRQAAVEMRLLTASEAQELFDPSSFVEQGHNDQRLMRYRVLAKRGQSAKSESSADKRT